MNKQKTTQKGLVASIDPDMQKLLNEMNNYKEGKFRLHTFEEFHKGVYDR